MTEGPAIDAGPFAAWLAEIEAAMRDGGESDVPCGSCTACCSASQFVHIGPEERDALEHIPAELLFPAPRMPRGHVLMGYDEHGRCPMLGDAGCTIYAHRPQTCRTYDCRIFPATGTAPDSEPDDETKSRIAARAAQWRFEHPSPEDTVLHDAVRAAATYLRQHADSLPAGTAPATATQRAVMAVRLHELFVDGAAPSPHDVEVAITRRR